MSLKIPKTEELIEAYEEAAIQLQKEKANAEKQIYDLQILSEGNFMMDEVERLDVSGQIAVLEELAKILNRRINRIKIKIQDEKSKL